MGLDSECDLAMESTGERGVEGAIAGFRNRLLGEHLGVSPQEVEKATARHESFIAAVEGLRGNGRTLMPLVVEDRGWVDGLIPDHSLIDSDEPIDPERLMNEFIPEEEKRLGKRKLIRFLIVLLLMSALAAAWRWTPLGEWLKIETFRGIKDYLAGNPASILIVAGAFLVGSIMVVPVTFMILLATFVFGPVPGGFYSFIGCVTSAVMNYGIGRMLGREKIGRLAGSRLREVSRRLTNHGLLTMTVVRFLPVAPFTVVNMVAGAMHIRLRDFVLGTIIGVIPGIIVIGVFEHQLENLIQRPGLGRAVFVALLILMILAGGGAVRRWLKRKKRSEVPS